MRVISVSVVVYGSALDPERLTRRLGVEPTAAHAPSVSRTLDLDGTVFEDPRRGCWTYDTAGAVASTELHAHLEHVLRTMARLPDAVAAAAGEECQLTLHLHPGDFEGLDELDGAEALDVLERALGPENEVMERAIGPERRAALERVGLGNIGWFL